jgi:uncharacterized membrane protein
MGTIKWDVEVSYIKMNRIPAIDNLRGLVMVLMTLDHTRDFFSNVIFNPLDLNQTNPALFLTRWITHFCAPVFIFLAGVSAFLSSQRLGKTQLSRFLLTRGLWITFLGITFESMVWSYTPDFSVISGSVLWAISWSMICLALLVFLPLPYIMVFSLVLITGHNAFDGFGEESFGSFGPLWAILHTGEAIQLSEHLEFEPYYPLIPWLGVMAIGYCFGSVLLLNETERNRMLYGIGITLTLIFIALRYSNLYGDPHPWTSQKSSLFTVFAFINCDKYPPSLCYLLMTSSYRYFAVDRPVKRQSCSNLMCVWTDADVLLLIAPAINHFAIALQFLDIYGSENNPRIEFP